MPICSNCGCCWENPTVEECPACHKHPEELTVSIFTELLRCTSDKIRIIRTRLYDRLNELNGQHNATVFYAEKDRIEAQRNLIIEILEWIDKK